MVRQEIPKTGGSELSIYERIGLFVREKQLGINDFNYTLNPFNESTQKEEFTQTKQLISVVRNILLNTIDNIYLDDTLVSSVHSYLKKVPNLGNNILLELLDEIDSRGSPRIAGGEGSDLFNAIVVVMIVLIIIYVFIVYGLGKSHRTGAVISVIGLAAMRIISKNMRCNILGGFI
jgi:hypothetical protein